MSVKTCPHCHTANAAGARRCAQCGRALRAGDTVPAELAATAPGRGAVWLDDLQAPEAAGAPAAPADEPVALTLRDVDPPPAVHQDAAADAPPPVELVVTDTPTEFPPLSTGIPDQPDPAAPAQRADARAARRASVRRARLRAAPARSAAGPEIPEVLVFDADDSARAALCELLLVFGYGVHSVNSVAKATALLARRRFVVAFVDIVPDGSDGGAGIDLCRQVKQAGAADAPTLLFQVSAQLRPVDRVRSKLAGCDDIVEKPVSRGKVAGVLDRHGIALPLDARHR